MSDPGQSENQAKFFTLQLNLTFFCWWSMGEHSWNECVHDNITGQLRFRIRGKVREDQQQAYNNRHCLYESINKVDDNY